MTEPDTVNSLDTSASSFETRSTKGLNLGLALSGGGLRATLFHLGVIRSLRDHGCLECITHICSVSGGSIMAAHLLQHWDKYTSHNEENFNAAAQEIINFARKDIRGRILRRGLSLFPLWIPLRKLSFNKLPAFTFTKLLMFYYDKFLFKNAIVKSLPKTPKLHILTTNLTNGGVCSIGQQGITIDFDPTQDHHCPKLLSSGAIPLALAVTCSSAFPGMFPPIRLHKSNIHVEEFLPEEQFFTDGGVFDNLGVRKFRQILAAENQSIKKVFISDAGQVFQRETAISWRDLILGTALRSSDILFDRITQSEIEISKNDSRFVFIRISERIPRSQANAPSSPSERYWDQWAIEEEYQPSLKFIRTDLDLFPQKVINALVVHGQSVTKKALIEHLNWDVDCLKEPWQPSNWKSQHLSQDTSKSLYYEYCPKTHKTIRDAHLRSLRLFSFRDYVSFVHILMLGGILLIALRVTPTFYENYILPLNAFWDHLTFTVPEGFEVWEAPSGVTIVDKLPDPYELNKNGFMVLMDSKLWDLRQIQDVPKSQIKTEPISPSLLKRVQRIKRIADQEKIFTVNFKTGGATIYPRVKDNQFPFEIQEAELPDYVMDDSVKEFALKIDVSSKTLEEEFDVITEAIFWNGFQGKEQWVGFQGDEDIEEITLTIIFPNQKPYKRVTDLNIAEVGEKLGIPKNIRILEDKDHRWLKTKINKPEKDFYYKLKWIW